MSEAANPEGADARSPHLSAEELLQWIDAAPSDCPAVVRMNWRAAVSMIDRALRVAESRGAKARDAEWREALEKSHYDHLDGLHSDPPGHPLHCLDCVPLRALMGNAPKAPADPASGSPSVPAAQQKDQANQGAAAQAVEPRGWFCPDCPMVVRTAVGAACPNCGAELLTPTTWRKMLNDLLAAERTSRRIALLGRDAALKADLADREVPATTVDVWKHHAAQMVQILRAASDEPRAAPSPALPREAPEPGGTLTGPCRCGQKQIGPSRWIVDGHGPWWCPPEQPRAAPSDSAPATPGLGPPSAGSLHARVKHLESEIAMAMAELEIDSYQAAYDRLERASQAAPSSPESPAVAAAELEHTAECETQLREEIDAYRIRGRSRNAARPWCKCPPAVAADAGDRKHE